MSDDPFETVWSLFAPPEGTQIAWAARRPEIVARRPEIVGGRLDSLASLRAFARRYERDCYFTPNPVAGVFGKRPSTANVAFIRCILIDIDPVAEVETTGSAGTDDADTRLLAQRNRTCKSASYSGYASCTHPSTCEIEKGIITHAENLLGFELHPDRIDSGRGRQLWLRFDPIPVCTEDEKQLWRSAVGNFLHRLDQDLGVVGGYRIDTSVCDLPRLVRLPGTINSKTGRRADVLGIGQSDSRIRTAILERFGLSSPYQRPQPSSGDWRRSFHLLSSTAKRFFSAGAPEPGRHAAAFAAAASMKDLGAGHDITERMVLLGARKCSPPLAEYEARRCVRNVFKGGLNGS